MNAVRLGMTLFSTEIDSLVRKMEGKSLEEVMGLLRETLLDWRQIAVDVLENSEAAVDVLNDLLNYDKVSAIYLHSPTLILTNALSFPPLSLYPSPSTPLLPLTPRSKMARCDWSSRWCPC
jgi:hypothetical protein